MLHSRVSMLTRPRIFTQCRRLATATPAKEILPLKGIKVLDMTRVLAGVSTIFFFFRLFGALVSALLFLVSLLLWDSMVLGVVDDVCVCQRGGN